MSNDTNNDTTTNIIATVVAQLTGRLTLLDDEATRIRKALQHLNGTTPLALLPTMREVVATTAAAIAAQPAAEATRRSKRKSSKRSTRRDKNAARAARVAARAAKQGAKSSKGSTTERAQNAQPLSTLLVEQLQAGPLSSGELVERVLATGFKTNAKNFRQNVYVALSKDARFKRTNDGTYVLAKGAK